jgi:hypothetical protein
MSELASESMNTAREADASDGGGRAREPINLGTVLPRAGLPKAIA